MLKNYAKEFNFKNVIGLDEVGWGSFAGPVVVGAVVLPPDFSSDLIKDSKKMTEKQRLIAYELIVSRAIAYSIQAGSVKAINQYGVEEAKQIAIRKCIEDIKNKVLIDYIIMDGNRFKNEWDIPHQTIPKGDNTYLSIAAAAIIAKVKRDEYMIKLHALYPDYNFNNNKGYFCQKHGLALETRGCTPYHREKYVNTWLKNK